MKVHDLKIWPEPFKAVMDGLKKYEFRTADRDFKLNDYLFLQEWDPTENKAGVIGHTGRWIVAMICYMSPAGKFGLPADKTILGIEVKGFGTADTDPWSDAEDGV